MVYDWLVWLFGIWVCQIDIVTDLLRLIKFNRRCNKRF